MCVFAALNVLDGTHIYFRKERHRHPGLQFLRLNKGTVPETYPISLGSTPVER